VAALAAKFTKIGDQAFPMGLSLIIAQTLLGRISLHIRKWVALHRSVARTFENKEKFLLTSAKVILFWHQRRTPEVRLGCMFNLFEVHHNSFLMGCESVHWGGKHRLCELLVDSQCLTFVLALEPMVEQL
jgi:hypothetical protein